MQTKPILNIYLLGVPEIVLDDAPITVLSNKTEALLFYLAATGQIHLRRTLATLLWGDVPEKNARANLRKAIHQLRTTLPGHLHVEQQRVGFFLFFFQLHRPFLHLLFQIFIEQGIVKRNCDLT